MKQQTDLQQKNIKCPYSADQKSRSLWFTSAVMSHILAVLILSGLDASLSMAKLNNAKFSTRVAETPLYVPS